MNTATHPVAPEEVMAFLDGELSAEQAQSVSAHVEQCAECAASAAEFRTVSDSLSDWRVPPVPESLSHRLVDSSGKMQAAMETRRPSIFIRASFWSWKQWTVGLGSAMAILLLIAAISIPNLMRPKMAYRRIPELSQEESKTNGTLGKLTATKPQQEVFTNQIPERPSSGREDTTLQELDTPLAATDTNGLTHGRGEHAENSESPRVGYGSGGGNGPVDFQQPMIARTVSLSIMVKDFAGARANLDVILARHHGYAAQLNASTAENAARSLNGSLRVPAGELSATVGELKALGRVQNESQGGEEVTQQHADLVARLKNSRETERRLQAILAERTGKISDVLAVEQEIARVRGEIEQMEGEQKSLEHRVDFATVDLNLNEEYKAQLVIPPLSAGNRLHNALVEGYRNASETLLGIVLFFAEYTLTLVIWAMILGFPIVLLWRRYRRALTA
jgi:Domain of unknown function (DUF4349)/Putative zinc-finger